jgi:hypothetical protein
LLQRAMPPLREVNQNGKEANHPKENPYVGATTG